MKNKKEVRGKRNTGFVGFLYVMSAILALVFVFMLISNISYIRSYIASYGMSAGDIIAESVQYIIKGSLNYFVYALLVFCAAKVLSIGSMNCKSAGCEEYEDIFGADGEFTVEKIETAESTATDLTESEDILEFPTDRYIDMSNAVESVEENAPVLTDAELIDFEEDNYRFEPDEVISRLGASKEKEKTVGTKIVEEATKGK